MHTYIQAHLRAYLHVHVDIHIYAHVIHKQVCGFGVQEAADIWATRRQAQVVSDACCTRYLQQSVAVCRILQQSVAVCRIHAAPGIVSHACCARYLQLDKCTI